MKYLIVLFCFFYTFIAAAQSSVNFGRVDQERQPARLPSLNVDSLRTAVFNAVSEEHRKTLGDRSSMKFAQETTSALNRIFEDGAIYRNWPEATGYLNKVANRVLALDTMSASSVRAYLLKSGEPNAFMTATGAFFINVGLLSELSSEEELAAVIAHEVAHFTLGHGIEGFLKQESGDFRKRLFFNSDRAISRFSIDNELAADELAVRYLMDAGYSAQGLLNILERFDREEKRRLLRMRDVWKATESTHPSSARRVEQVRSLTEQPRAEDLLPVTS